MDWSTSASGLWWNYRKTDIKTVEMADLLHRRNRLASSHRGKGSGKGKIGILMVFFPVSVFRWLSYRPYHQTYEIRTSMRQTMETKKKKTGVASNRRNICKSLKSFVDFDRKRKLQLKGNLAYFITFKVFL